MAVDLSSIRLLLAGVSAVVYSIVGYVIGKRDISPEGRPANRSFQFWWYFLAILTLFNPLMILINRMEAGQTGRYFQLRLFLFTAVLVGIVVAIGALVYYLLYVYTGKPWVFWPVAIYHFVLLTWLMFLIIYAQPYKYSADCTSGWCYNHDFANTAASKILSLAIILPILAGAVAYFALFFRVHEAAQKYRIALVGGGLILWFGTSLVAGQVTGDFETANGNVARVALSQWVYWSYIIAPLISLTAAALILMAYRPPWWVRERLAPGTGG